MLEELTQKERELLLLAVSTTADIYRTRSACAKPFRELLRLHEKLGGRYQCIYCKALLTATESESHDCGRGLRLSIVPSEAI